MKNLKLTLILIAVTISANAQTDSTFYFLDKSTLANNVLCNFTDSVYWGMYDGIKEKTLSNKYAFEIVSEVKLFENRIGKEICNHNNLKIRLCLF